MNRRIFSTIRAPLIAAALCSIAAAASANSSVQVGDPANPGGLQSAIDAAYAAGAQSIVIAPGRYLLPPGPSATLFFHNYKNFDIIATNVDLSIQSTDKEAVVFSGCDTVKFIGATIHYSAPQTGQAKILTIGEDADGVYYDVQPDIGFPANSDFRASAIKIGDSVHIRPGTGDFGAKGIDPGTQPGTERIHWNGVPRGNTWGVQVGDYVVCRGPGGMMLHATNCAHCTFENISIYWSGCFAFFDTDHGVANRWIGDTLSYGPIPPGATNRALLSESADSFHCASDTVGPDIENCTLEGQLDDGIAIHGRFYQIAQTVGKVVTIGSDHRYTDFKVGDPIRICNNDSGLLVDATVVGIAPSSFTTTQVSKFGAFKKVTNYFDLTIDRDVNAPFDSLASDPGQSGAGFKIIGCTIRDQRARGMLIKADNGLIQNNLIDGSTIAGIVVTPETYWGEAGYSKGIVIEGNTIRHTNYAMTGPWYPQAGALTITGEGSMGQRNIVIRNNTFEDINVANIEVRWADGVTIQGNKFLNPHAIPSPVGDVGQSNGCDGNSVIWIANSKNVLLKNNIVSNLGASGGALLVVDPSATAITGASNGLRLKGGPATSASR